MNWPLFWQLLVTVILAFAGAWLAHTFAANRDRANKRREQQIDFLIQAYRRLESVSNRSSSSGEDMKQVESAIADIQFFGSANQIRLAQNFVNEFAAKRTASLDNLLETLRDDLRRELQLEKAPNSLVFLRWSQSSLLVERNDNAINVPPKN